MLDALPLAARDTIIDLLDMRSLLQWSCATRAAAASIDVRAAAAARVRASAFDNDGVLNAMPTRELVRRATLVERVRGAIAISIGQSPMCTYEIRSSHAPEQFIDRVADRGVVMTTHIRSSRLIYMRTPNDYRSMSRNSRHVVHYASEGTDSWVYRLAAPRTTSGASDVCAFRAFASALDDDGDYDGGAFVFVAARYQVNDARRADSLRRRARNVFLWSNALNMRSLCSSVASANQRSKLVGNGNCIGARNGAHEIVEVLVPTSSPRQTLVYVAIHAKVFVGRVDDNERALDALRADVARHMAHLVRVLFE